MPDVSNLKINERWNAERPKLRVINIGIKIEKIHLFQWANMRIGKIASSPEYWIDEKFHNFKFLVKNFGFPN